MKISQALTKYTDIESDLILAHALEVDRVFLITHPDFILSDDQIEKYSELCEKRKTGVPVAYLLGYKWFMGDKYIVNEHTLIPRPETEDLVKMVAQDAGGKKDLSIIDIGTGSGCIAISLSRLIGQNITASDISAEALAVAKQNAQGLNKNINWIRSDLFSNITDHFDYIVANLPYVTNPVYEKNLEGIKYEPQTAILLPHEGFLDTFITQAKEHLKSGGKIYMEIDPENLPEIEQASKKNGLNLTISKDSNHLIRYITLSIPS